MATRSSLRIAAAAIVLCTLSFAVGVAGDLSDPQPVHGARVVVEIPPATPVARVAPAAAMPRTAAAEARPAVARRQPAAAVAAPAPAAATNPALAAFVSEHELFHSEPTPAQPPQAA